LESDRRQTTCCRQSNDGEPPGDPVDRPSLAHGRPFSLIRHGQVLDAVAVEITR
jgi:hypothetical protein